MKTMMKKMSTMEQKLRGTYDDSRDAQPRPMARHKKKGSKKTKK